MLIVELSMPLVQPVYKMTDPSPSSPLGSHQSSIISGGHHPHLHPHDPRLQTSFNSNGKMRLGKSNIGSVTSVELPPLVGVPHSHDKRLNHQTTPDSTTVPAVCRGALESETPAGPGTSSPLMRRRLKYMVRQCSDSELLKNNSSLGRLPVRITPSMSDTASPVPHPPDQSLRSQNSSETNSQNVLCKHQRLHSSRSGPSRASRSLEASPMVSRRLRGGVLPNSGDQDSPSSSVPPSPPCSEQGQKRRPRPFSFGSYTDVLQYVGSNNDPSQALTASPRGPGSPFAARRTVSLRGVVLPPSRPDTPANDALSIHDSKKSNQMPSSSGERNEFEDDEASLVFEDCTNLEETTLPRRRLRRDSGSQHAQRNSNGPISSECNRNFPKNSQHVTAPLGIDPHYQYSDHVIDHVVDDDTGYPSNLYDIQERRESILSIEAVQEIARRFANNGVSDSDDGTNETDEDVQNQDTKITKTRNEKVPDYRKQPLSADKRVSNWLKGIQDPTEGVPTNIDKILPDII